MAVLFSGNGFHSKEWWAKGEGRAMELGKVLEPLESVQGKAAAGPRPLQRRGRQGGIHSAKPATCSPVPRWKEAAAFVPASAWIRPSPSGWVD